MSRTTNIDLVAELEAKNIDGKYDEIIENAKNNLYHDFKSNATMPKILLIQELGRHPELNSIKQNVMGGMYDEPMDKEDKASMLKDLKEGGDDGRLAKALGLKEEDE